MAFGHHPAPALCCRQRRTRRLTPAAPADKLDPRVSPIDPKSSYYEFGPFRLDQGSRSLYLGNEFVAVTPKALDTLFLLVENAGRLVSKEDVMQRVWPDAFVEEGSIANNISILRKILNPHFEDETPIATVARRGYRFTAPVQLRTPPAATEIPTPKEISTAKASPSGTRPALLLAAFAVLALVMAGAAAFWVRPSAQTDSVPRRSVAVLPMKNLSGDTSQAWLSTALAETISAELAGGNHFRMVSGDNIVRMQQELAPPMGVGLTRKQLDDIGRDLACDLILTGNYLVVGGKVRVDVRLDEVATGEAVATASVTDTTDRFLDIVSKAGGDLRAALKIDPQTAADADAMRAAFSSTPDALQKYFQGLEALRLRDGPKARDFLLEAVKADDDFALANAALSATWRLLGYDKRGAESAKRAMDLSSRLSREDRLGVEAQYQEATSQWPKAIELYQQLWTLYPDNVEYGLKLGNAQWLGGKSADTLKTVGQLRKLPERDSRDARIDLLEATAADLQLDRTRATEAADRAAAKATAAKANLMLARTRIKQGIYASRVGKADEALAYWRESEALFRDLKDTGGEADAIRWQGTTLVDRNRVDDGRALLERANTVAAPLNYVRLASTIQSGLANAYRLKGDLLRAVDMAEQSIANARECGDRTLLAGALTTYGTVLRYRGEYTRAREVQLQAAAEADAIGDARTRNNALNNAAVIDFLLGDLADARSKYEAILADDRKQGSKPSIALRLGNLSRVIALQGNLADAEKMTEEECRIQDELKNTVGLAWCRARLAEIYVDRGKKADAESTLARIAVADYGSAVTAPVYIARFARANLALGKTDAAADAIAAAERVQQQAGKVDDQAWQVAIVRGQVDAARGRRAASIASLQRIALETEKRGLKTIAADARGAMAKLRLTQQIM